jgi:hypothetical protein
MSRVVGRTKSIREATVSWALPHLQLATLPGAMTTTSPSHLWQPGPRRGGAAM